MSRFKPGDIVRVRDLDDLENTFGYRGQGSTIINVIPGFTSGMRVYCGGTYKVSWVGSSGVCTLYGAGWYYFADDVLEPAEQAVLNDLPDISEDDFQQILGGVL